MIAIWTKMVRVEKTSRTWIFAFSDFIDRIDPTCNLVMDDCIIVSCEYQGGKVKDEQHELATMLRDTQNNSGFLYGGQTILPSGHRRFTFVPEKRS